MGVGMKGLPGLGGGGLGGRGGRIAISYVHIRMYFYDNYGSVDIFGGVTSL